MRRMPGRRRPCARLLAILALAFLPFVGLQLVLQIDWLHQGLCTVERDVGGGAPVPVEVAAPSRCHATLHRAAVAPPLAKGELLVCHAPELACSAALERPILPGLVWAGLVELGLLVAWAWARLAPPDPET